jgi:hypothetical protein
MLYTLRKPVEREISSHRIHEVTANMREDEFLAKNDVPLGVLSKQIMFSITEVNIWSAKQSENITLTISPLCQLAVNLPLT